MVGGPRDRYGMWTLIGPRFGDLPADRVDVDVEQVGTWTVVVGPSGAGVGDYLVLVEPDEEEP